MHKVDIEEFYGTRVSSRTGPWSKTRLQRKLNTMANQDPHHVCIIDDSPTHLTHLKALLKPIPQVAIETFDRASADALKYIDSCADLVIVDNLMPGVSGIEFVRTLRNQASLSATPVLMLTADPDLTTRWDALDEGVTAFLTKPINPFELRSTVRKLLLL